MDSISSIGKVISLSDKGTGTVIGHTFKIVKGKKRHFYHIAFNHNATETVLPEEDLVACLAKESQANDVKLHMTDFFGGTCGIGDSVTIANKDAALVIGFYNCYNASICRIQKKHLLRFENGKVEWFELTEMVEKGTAVITRRKTI